MTPGPGLPDFSQPLGAGTTRLFAPFGEGQFAVLPAGARVAVRQGAPALALALVRQPDTPGRAGAYAVLDVEVEEDVPLDAGLALARTVHGDATVAPAAVALGFARLVPGGPTVALPVDMTTPVPLGWSAAAGARWTQRLGVDTGELIKGALLGGTLLFGARLELSIAGVAARAAASIEFVPARLIDALLAGSTDRSIGAARAVERLTASGLPVTIGGTASADAVAQAFADRLLAAYATFVAAAGAGDPPCFRFADTPPVERVTWDLSTPAGGVRAFALALDPPGRLQDAARLIHEISIPPLDLGFREIIATANLPPGRTGIPAIGARISLPPNPPARPSGINETAVFTSPDETARVDLRLSPDEAFDYTVTPFAVLAAGAAVAQLDGAARPGSGPWLHLQARDFPLTFAHIVASDRLLAQATLAGALTYTAANGRAASQPIALRQGAAAVAVAAPAGATDAAITLTATAPSGATARLTPVPPRILRLDLASFAGYGPHRVAISAPLAADAMPMVIELASEDGATQSTVMLTPASPSANWGYVAGSPFQPGFRFRVQGGQWSAVLAPTPTLSLTAAGVLAGNGSGATDPPAAPDAFDIDGIRFAPSDDAATLFYLPAAATPELDAAGRPTLSIFRMPQATTLQLGAHFDLDAATLAALPARLAAQVPALATARLQPAPMTVRKAAVVLAGDAETELASSTSSAFPPYAAIFNITLTPAQAAQVISAVGGRRGVLFVDYTIRPAGTDAPLVKRADVATWFAGTDGLTHIHAFG